MTTSKKRKSGTSRSALRFNLFALCLLLAASIPALGVEGDRFLFRVGDQVVGVNDVGQVADDLDALHCHFQDSVLLEYLGEGYRAKLREQFTRLGALQGPLAAQTPAVIFLGSLRRTWKLLAYVDTQEVTVSQDLEKTLLGPSSCPPVKGADKKMRGSFQRWLRVEVYLRSRYAQGRPGSEAERKDKRFHSIDLFVDSLDKQTPHENFW